jgi:hypothetical protein
MQRSDEGFSYKVVIAGVAKAFNRVVDTAGLISRFKHKAVCSELVSKLELTPLRLARSSRISPFYLKF